MIIVLITILLYMVAEAIGGIARGEAQNVIVFNIGCAVVIVWGIVLIIKRR